MSRSWNGCTITGCWCEGKKTSTRRESISPNATATVVVDSDTGWRVRAYVQRSRIQDVVVLLWGGNGRAVEDNCGRGMVYGSTSGAEVQFLTTVVLLVPVFI